MSHDPRTAERGRILLERLRAVGGKALSIRDLMQRIRANPGERTAIKRVLRDLVQQGELIRQGKRYALPAPREVVSSQAVARPGMAIKAKSGGLSRARRGAILGTLTRHRDGYGFVARVDRRGEDVFVPPEEAAKALDGDLVSIDIVPAPRGRSMGRIRGVVERRRRWILGTFHSRGRSSFVIPADQDLRDHVAVVDSGVAQDGDLVKVALDDLGGPLTGVVVERVGRPGSPQVEVLEVAYAKGFSDLFPEDAQLESESTPDHVRPEDRQNRRDLGALQLVTIDGEDARDFDDAVFVERVRGRGKARYRAVIAIADVAHYVREGSALDAEALRRGTSVYFPAQVLPMLPERLSNGICSLNPGVDRLCMVADLIIDEGGEPISAELYEGVMRSAARCTYSEVARVLAGEPVPGRDGFRAQFELMAELQEKLTAMRARRGSIDFDIPESRIVLGQEGQVIAIERRPRNRAHRIVEELMLAANEAVARHFGDRERPTIYRVHGTPDEEKLDAFRRLARTQGFEVPEGALDPRAINRLLAAIEGHAQQRALNQLLLRAMMQAVYAHENIGHYGLAAEHYLHFTSPIRRYPDLMVHRLLKQEWARAEGVITEREGVRGRRSARSGPDLAEVAALCSERERAAMQAEREVDGFYAALFMRDHVGERFGGVVSSVVEFGLFVEIAPWFVEGLVKIADLGEDWVHDPDHFALVQRRTGSSFRVGDAVEVVVEAASPARRQIDLRLVEEAGTAASGTAAGKRGEGAPRPRRPARKGKAAVGKRTGKRRETRKSKPSGRRKTPGKKARRRSKP